MRVLLAPRPEPEHVVGGSMIRMQETVRALRRLGVEAELASIDEAVEAEPDIAHVFGDVRPLLAHHRLRGRLVVTPMAYPRSFFLSATRDYRRAERRHMFEVRLRYQARKLRHPRSRLALLRDLRGRADAWRRADLVFVNSKAEADWLRRDIPGLRDIRVSHCGVAEEAFHGDPVEGRRLVGIGSEPFVLCVARIESIKNQISLALAVRDLGVRLVLVGVVLPGRERFYAELRAVLPEVIHVPHVEHEQLRHVHAAAAAHALPSWYEATGLSTLEALAVGTPVVVARGPGPEEYFRGIARFCEPDNVGSIRDAVLRALEGPTGAEQEWARRFSWDRAATELVESYQLLSATGG